MGTELNGSAIKEVAELVRASVKLGVTTVPAEPFYVYYITHPDGKSERVIAALPPVKDELGNPYELLNYLKDFQRRQITATDGIILANQNSVDYRYKLEGSINRASVPLRTTPAWDAVSAFWNEGTGECMQQADLYRLLRVTLKGTLSQGNALANQVRSIKWTNNNEAESTIDQARKTIGTSAVAEVQSKSGAGLPESFEVTLNVFENFAHPVTIQIDLDSIPEQRQFRLTPYPGELDRALAKTMEEITAIFDGVKVPAFVAACEI